MYKTFISSIMAGIMIGVGATVYLSNENRVIGAFMFAVGLFTIIAFELHLYTGRICYAFENKRDCAKELFVVWAGNCLGAAVFAYLLKLTRARTIGLKAAELCVPRTTDSLLSIFILSVFCGIMLYISVESGNIYGNTLGRYIGVFLCIAVFILSGYEHCIANVFFFSIADMWSPAAAVNIAVATLGNSIGGMLMPILRKISSPQ